MTDAPKKAFDPARYFRKLRHSISKRIQWWRLRRKFTGEWDRPAGHAGFAKRSYQSYDEYVEHQRSKLAILNLEKYDEQFRTALKQRLGATDLSWRGKTALCLAARVGSEVKAFIDLGCFAVGIDLNPGKENHYVVHGDFHALQYATDSVDIVFTNSLDHAFDIKRIAIEVKRVLKPAGMLIIEAMHGEEEGAEPGFFESFFWSNTDDLARAFEEEGFRLAKMETFEFPWKGQQLWLEKLA